MDSKIERAKVRREKTLLAELDWLARRRRVNKALDKLEPTTGTKYFIWFKGREYSPKQVRSVLESRAVSEFSGGRETNDVFRDLGFTVVSGRDRLAAYRHSVTRLPETKRLIRDLDPQLRSLFDQVWVPLETAIRRKDISHCPGVYLLAYGKGLSHKRVDVEHVFYVGMSTTALKTRLQQFWDGIHDGGHHSGAKRFYRRWTGGKSFGCLRNTGNKFYVATCPVECEPNKGLRTPSDLERMGTVTALEFLALARIKQELGVEPPLNRK
jgi:hypothetical protein